MTYDIPELLDRYYTLLGEITREFERFFREVDYSTRQPKIKQHMIRLPADLVGILAGPGFYLIATDLPTEDNPCTLTVGNGLPVVYRGQGYHVRERIESHLFYDRYRAKKSTLGYTVSIKLGNVNINVDEASFSDYQWLVVTHSMPRSIRPIRETAEEAFDNVFGRPVGSSR
jgi:hypothetical protein